MRFASTEATPEATRPVVRAVMFWINGCPSCHNVLENVLPPLQEKYGEQFQVHLIEVVGLDDYETWSNGLPAWEYPRTRFLCHF